VIGGLALHEFAVLEVRAGPDEGDQVRGVDASAMLSGLISFKAIAMPAALDLGPLVTLVRCRTVARSTRWDSSCAGGSVLGREVVEREQLLEVVGDPGDGLG